MTVYFELVLLPFTNNVRTLQQLNSPVSFLLFMPFSSCIVLLFMLQAYTVNSPVYFPLFYLFQCSSVLLVILIFFQWPISFNFKFLWYFIEYRAVSNKVSRFLFIWKWFYFAFIWRICSLGIEVCWQGAFSFF